MRSAPAWCCEECQARAEGSGEADGRRLPATPAHLGRQAPAAHPNHLQEQAHRVCTCTHPEADIRARDSHLRTLPNSTLTPCWFPCVLCCCVSCCSGREAQPGCVLGVVRGWNVFANDVRAHGSAAGSGRTYAGAAPCAIRLSGRDGQHGHDARCARCAVDVSTHATNKHTHRDRNASSRVHEHNQWMASLAHCFLLPCFCPPPAGTTISATIPTFVAS